MFTKYLKLNPQIMNLIISVSVVVLIYLMARLAKYKAKKTQERLNLDKSRYLMIKRMITIFSILFIFSTLIFIWGINLRQVWVTLSGIAAMVAIAFFAIWSLLGNILAGVLLYFTAPFKINDNIEISPDNIVGKVLAINTFYTVLLSNDNAYICVPNALFFQKYIKNYKNNVKKG